MLKTLNSHGFPLIFLKFLLCSVWLNVQLLSTSGFKGPTGRESEPFAQVLKDRHWVSSSLHFSLPSFLPLPVAEVAHWLPKAHTLFPLCEFLWLSSAMKLVWANGMRAEVICVTSSQGGLCLPRALFPVCSTLRDRPCVEDGSVTGQKKAGSLGYHSEESCPTRHICFRLCMSLCINWACYWTCI